MVISKRFWIVMMLAAMIVLIANPSFADGADCPPYSTYLKQYQGDNGECWICKIFMLFFDVGNEVAGHIAKVIETPAKKLMGVGLGIWILCHTAMFFSNLVDAPDIMAHLTNIFGGMLRAGIATAFLSGGSTAAFNYFVNPILSSAAEYTTVVLTDVPCPAGSNNGTLNRPMGPGVRSSMECMIKQLSNGMAPTQALAAGLRCGALYWIPIKIPDVKVSIPLIGEVEIMKGKEFGHIPNPIAWLWGCWLGVSFWAIGFLFPLVLLDVLFRICIILGMLPLFVISWVFPSTRRYASAGWSIFLYACFAFVVSAMMIGMIVKMVEMSWVVSAGKTLGAFRAQIEAGQYLKAFTDLELAGGIINLLMVVAIAFFAIYIAPQTDKFTDKIIGDGQYDFGDSVALRTVKAMINGVIDVICFVLTVVTLGAGACVYVIKVAQYTQKTVQEIQRMQKIIRKMREVQQKVSKYKQRLRQAQQAM